MFNLYIYFNDGSYSHIEADDYTMHDGYLKAIITSDGDARLLYYPLVNIRRITACKRKHP